MSFKEIDLRLMACMFDKNRIASHHGNVENILKFCTPKDYRDSRSMGLLKKRLRRLAAKRYLIRKVGRFEAYSLSMQGVKVVEMWKEGWSVEQINEEEEKGGFSNSL